MFDSQTALDHADASRKRLDTLYDALKQGSTESDDDFRSVYEWLKTNPMVFVHCLDEDSLTMSYRFLTRVVSVFTRIFHDGVLCHKDNPNDKRLVNALDQNALVATHQEKLTSQFREFMNEYKKEFDKHHEFYHNSDTLSVVCRVTNPDESDLNIRLDTDSAHFKMFVRLVQMTRPGAWCIFTTPQELVLAYETAVLFEMTDHLPALLEQLEKNLSDGFRASLPVSTEFNARTSLAMKFRAPPPKKEMSLADQLRANTRRLQEETKAKEEQQEVPDSDDDEDDDQERDEDQ